MKLVVHFALEMPVSVSSSWTSQVVQWLRLCTSKAGGTSSIPGRGSSKINILFLLDLLPRHSPSGPAGQPHFPPHGPSEPLYLCT